MQTLISVKELAYEPDYGNETLEYGSGRGRGKSTVKRQLACNLLHNNFPNP